MLAQQLSVFIENRAGRLEEITGILAEHAINIRALSLADSSDFGILRLIVQDPEAARNLLEKEGFTVVLNEVIAVEIEDHPGGLFHILKSLGEAGISIEYMYGFLERRSQHKAIMVLRIEDAAHAIERLESSGCTLLKAREVYTL